MKKGASSAGPVVHMCNKTWHIKGRNECKIVHVQEYASEQVQDINKLPYEYKYVLVFLWSWCAVLWGFFVLFLFYIGYSICFCMGAGPATFLANAKRPQQMHLPQALGVTLRYGFAKGGNEPGGGEVPGERCLSRVDGDRRA